MRIQIHFSDAQKLYKKITTGEKIFLSPVFLEGRPSYRRILQPSKENMQNFKT
jgi:hypothetical protein